MIRLLLFTFILAIVLFVAEQYMGVSWLHPRWPVMLGFYLCLGFLGERLVSIGLQGNREHLVAFLLGVTVVHMVAALAFAGFFLYRHIPDRRTFIINFLVLYICYRGFEIWTMNRNLRRDS
ncbi:hypothetical protein GCM10027578_06120 [Spirosoma luteolum]